MTQLLGYHILPFQPARLLPLLPHLRVCVLLSSPSGTLTVLANLMSRLQTTLQEPCKFADNEGTLQSSNTQRGFAGMGWAADLT